MRFSPARLLSLATLVPALLLFVVVPGCAKQSEGERCGDEPPASNDTCADGLTCTPGGSLIGGELAGNRCCRSDGSVTDSRCERNGDQPTGNTTDGAAGDTGQSSDAGNGSN
jgi:hypothetical protein